jgi:hypothetical protein
VSYSASDFQGSTYYPFRSSEESGTKSAFQDWLDKRYGRRFVRYEFQTVDVRGIPPDKRRAVTRQELDLIENGSTVLVLASAGLERPVRVCKAMGYKKS